MLLRPRYSQLRTSRGTLASVPSVGGTPRELVENVEYADWSTRGDLAVVRVAKGGRLLESPPGTSCSGPGGGISHPRFSSTAEQIAFLHHPVYGDDMGEVVVVDRSGKARTLSMSGPPAVAWHGPQTTGRSGSPRGRDRRNGLQPSRLGAARDVYASTTLIELEDIRRMATFCSTATSNARRPCRSIPRTGTLLTWSDWTVPLTAVSDDGKVLFGSFQPVGTQQGLQPQLAILRSMDGSRTQVLGRDPLDLSADGRWALLQGESGEALSIVPTGAGRTRTADVHGLAVIAARWMPDQKTILVAGHRPNEGESRLYQLTEEGQLSGPIGEARLGGRRVCTSPRRSVGR